MKQKTLFIILILLSLTQLSYGQKPISPTKKKLVAQLITKTSEIFPVEAFETIFQKTNEEKSFDLEKDLTEMITSKVDTDENLSAQRKAEVKAKIPELTQNLAGLAKELIGQGFDVKIWIDEAFNKHYGESFTVAELQKLNTYFQTTTGKKTVKLFHGLILGGIKGDDKEPDGATIIQMETFLKTPVGEKFFNVLLENIFKEISGKTDLWSKEVIRNIEKSMSSGEMKRLVEEFLAKNIKA